MKKLISLLCALALSPLALLAADKFPDISHDELKAAIAEKKVALIDVNGSNSYKAGHIPGAVDFESTADLAKTLPADKGALVVAYCANEQCSAYQQAAKAAKALGYTNVKHYPKGIQGWKKAGETTEKGS
jgi:rhodanese-related sulfurtransferase